MSRLVTVARFWDGPEMYAAIAALRAAGFHPCVGEFNHAMVNPLLFVALGGVRISLPEQEAESAAELIRRCREGDGANGHADDIHRADRGDGVLCPRCGSGTYFRLKSWPFAVALFLAWGFYAPLTTGRLLCRMCGHKWRAGEVAA